MVPAGVRRSRLRLVGSATLDPLIHTYLAGRVRRGEIKANTAAILGDRLRSLAASFGDTPVERLDRQAIEAWEEAVFPRLAPASRCSYLSTIRGFCGWLTTEGHVAADPGASVPALRRPRSVPRAQTADGVARLFAVCRDDRDRLIVWLMVGLGLRRGEVAGARLEDYDAAAATLHVTGKAGHQRSLPVPAEVGAAIAACHPGLWNTGPLVSHRSTRRPLDPRTVGQLVTALFRRAGLKRAAYDGVSGHALRHTAASDVLDACHDLRVVQQMLGHSSLASTQVYLRRANLDQLRSAMSGRAYAQGDSERRLVDRRASA